MAHWAKRDDTSEGPISTFSRFSVVRSGHRILGDLGVMAVQSFSRIMAKCSVSELRSRIVLTQTFDPPLPGYPLGAGEGRVRGTMGAATLIAPSPPPSPVQGEGGEMSVTVFAKRSTKPLQV